MKKFFRPILLILNVIVAVSLALACLCCFINPKTIWWIGFFGLAYMYLLAANLCFLIFWAFSPKKKYFLISMVTILFGWTFVQRNVQLFGKKIPEEELNNSAKILSFNVQGFSQKNSKQYDGKILNLFGFLVDEDPDIICMQEFSTSWRIDLREANIRKQLDKTPFYHIELTEFSPYYSSGIATFSKYPIVRKELVYEDGTNNICMCSDLLIGTDTVRLYNVHLKSVGFQHDEMYLLNNMVKKEYDSSDIRAIISIIRQIRDSSFARSRQVAILSSHIAQSPYPVIICGDFNDPPTSYSYRKVRGNRKDAFVEAGVGRSATYDIGRIASLRIDFILYSDVFRAYSYESPRVRLSDHFPVMCRLVKNRIASEKETQQ